MEPIDIHSTSQLMHINWTPGIGDPTFVGWLTVIAYFVASFFYMASAKRMDEKTPSKNTRSQRRLYWFIAIVLILLGINKQLDLQTLITEIGKTLAIHQGWYEQRREVQVFFIVGILFSGLISIELVWRAYRNTWKEHWLTVVGFVFLICFVVIRAASFHHIDLLLRRHIASFNINCMLELGGIFCILVSGIINFKRRKKNESCTIGHRNIYI